MNDGEIASLLLKKYSPETFSSFESQHTKFTAKGLIGSGMSVFASCFYENCKYPQLWVLENKEDATYFFNDLEQLLGGRTVLFYPATCHQPYQINEVDNTNILYRAKVLNKLQSFDKLIIVTYPDALFEKVIPQNTIDKNIFNISIGHRVDLEFLNETLFEHHFKQVDFVSEPGEFSVRGGIVDVFSYDNEKPYRIEFFGSQIESIRLFDIESQLSLKAVDNLNLTPNLDHKNFSENRQSFLKSIPSNTILFFKDLSSTFIKTEALFQKAMDNFNKYNSENVRQIHPKGLFNTAENHKTSLDLFKVVECSSSTYYKDNIVLDFAQKPQPPFNKQFDLLIASLNKYYSKGFNCYIACDSLSQSKRFEDIFRDIGKDVHYSILKIKLHRGFIDSNLKICCFTDHEIFDRYHNFKLNRLNSKKQAYNIKNYNTLSIGDYVTHIDHGIGIFSGLKKIDVGGKKQEAIKLIYGDRDILYVSIHSLHKISKYSNKDNTPPKIFKLGSKAWASLKEKAKRRIKELAFNLIDLYAKRTLKKGFAFAPDSYLQHELEASFIYEDTPDQITATAAVKSDMESQAPMDRLICGDVGFGKTEIAIRAAFKAVDNSKQVAILVPTTILAFQHWKVFTKRLKDLPVNIDYLNRFRTKKDRTEIIRRLYEGKIDIIIGTQQLINKAIKFKDLGLLVVDEEQKFGVAVKDKLKTIKENVDVLTLTATPIPRTLQFSLMSARDLSIINSPPPNRCPIESVVTPFSETLIRNSITYEIQRDGQVFVIHNRIENIKEISGMIKRLVPDARVAIGHGQMEGKTLEKVILDFMENRFDVLVSTSIVENGIDIPNANTMIINNAHSFGLSDLHQMRGRVGRSNKKSFCYFITIPKAEMTNEARQRITAVEQFTELGEGFNIAMKDLEIRGSGDLLGGEQSGFISNIGFDTYQKILQSAIKELKESDFKNLKTEPKDEPANTVQIDTDFEVLLPNEYVNSTKERLEIYYKLAEVKNEDMLLEFKNNLIDRFGKITYEIENLLNSVRLKFIASRIGLERLVIKNNKMNGYFLSNQQSDFYDSSIFNALLNKINRSTEICQINQKETKNGLKLFLSFQKIDSIEKALNTLNSLLKN